MNRDENMKADLKGTDIRFHIKSGYEKSILPSLSGSEKKISLCMIVKR